MQIKLKRNSALSDEYVIYPVYEIDIEKMALLSGYSLDNSGIVYTVAQTQTDYIAQKITCESTALYQCLSNKIPLSNSEDGNIITGTLQYIYDDVTGNYLPDNYADFETIELGAEPDDWGRVCDYYTLDSYTSVGKVFVRFTPVSITATFNSSTQYYHYIGDANANPVQLFYLDSGNHFSVIRQSGYSTYSKYVSFGRDLVGTWGQPYALSDDTRTLKIGSGTLSTNSGLGRAYTQSRSAANFQSPFDGSQIFVHYKYNSIDYVGIAILQYSNGAPSNITLTGINIEYFGDNIITGGDTGIGEWGDNTKPIASDGTFTADSDTRGTGTSDDATAIQQDITFALQNKINAGYTIHRIDIPNNITTSLNNVTYFYKALFTSNFLGRFLNSFYNPLSSIINCILLPENLVSNRVDGNPAAEVPSTITASGFDIGHEMSDLAADDGKTVSGTYLEQNPTTAYFVGSFDVDNYFGGYADFAPFTKCYLHLPYIGVQEIDINQIAHGKIAVTYVCDAMTGNVAAWIWCNDKNDICTYKYICTGNAAVTLKLAQNSLSGNPLQAIGGILGTIGGIATGNPIMAVGGAVGAASSFASATKPSIQSTGQFGGDFGLISDSTCWIEFVRPQWVQPEHYQKINGIPSGCSGTINDNGQGVGYTGFCAFDGIDLENVSCTEQEKQMIETLLKQGIYINREEM